MEEFIMANVKVAINGFGRIGRLAFRQMFGAEGYEIVAINDLTSPKMLAHLLKYDSTQGNYANSHTVESCEAVLNEDGTIKEDGYIVVDGKKITIYAKAKAAELPWGELGVDVVLECTGFYTSKAKAQAHIDAGARKVVISAPAGNDLPTIVYNVNHTTLKATDNIISAASCTTNCLAPMAKALNDYATIMSGIMTTVHAYTGDQMPLDGPQRKGDLRRSRAAAINIVPNSTGAAKAIGLVIPELNGKSTSAHRRRRTQSRHLRTRRQRPSHNRLQRKPHHAQSNGHHHLRSKLHHQLPRSYGKGSQRLCTDYERYYDHGSRIHGRPNAS